ncbi:MAG: 16S rRNA (cytosine(1402)-N(4))-methyltransferase RsmH [Peptococcaceae bacterium]|nr:16S rRNA (cytosine(1402)-N(4))-methyltransferase RsmH [Peptococcaceae bacterium]
MAFHHIPVLYQEVLDGLALKKGGIYVDGTVGGGGHSAGILEAIGESGRLLAIDQDTGALAAAKEHLQAYANQVSFFHANFIEMPRIIDENAPDGVDGILIDIGVSSPQIDDAQRGFSYMHDAPLDMRMNPEAALSAYEVVNTYGEDELERILRDYGEEKWARRIAKIIVERRASAPIATTFQLVDCIERAIPKGAREKGSHVAKRSFQAIRIEVNGELDVLEGVLDQAVARLKIGGRMAVITFHSLEDRIVKQHFKYLASDCICPPELPICQCDKEATVKIITRKPIVASKEELASNSRAGSAKLRIVEKIPPYKKSRKF